MPSKKIHPTPPTLYNFPVSNIIFLLLPWLHLFLGIFFLPKLPSVHIKMLFIYPSLASHVVKFRHAYHQDFKVPEFAPLCFPSEYVSIPTLCNRQKTQRLTAGPSDPALALIQTEYLFSVGGKATPIYIMWLATIR